MRNPSYNRPEGKTLFELIKDPSLHVILFIRKEQEDLYREYKNHFKIVKLSGVSNLGNTRHAMVNYLYAHKIYNCFMLDDDISKFSYLVKGMTKTGNRKLMLQKVTQG